MRSAATTVTHSLTTTILSEYIHAEINKRDQKSSSSVRTAGDGLILIAVAAAAAAAGAAERVSVRQTTVDYWSSARRETRRASEPWRKEGSSFLHCICWRPACQPVRLLYARQLERDATATAAASVGVN